MTEYNQDVDQSATEFGHQRSRIDSKATVMHQDELTASRYSMRKSNMFGKSRSGISPTAS